MRTAIVEYVGNTMGLNMSNHFVGLILEVDYPAVPAEGTVWKRYMVRRVLNAPEEKRQMNWVYEFNVQVLSRWDIDIDEELFQL